MITSIYINDIQNIFREELDTLTYPLQKFTWDYPMAGDTISRPFSAGRYDTRRSISYMTINCEGEIIGDTTDDYWDKRRALAQCVLPLAQQPFQSYAHSKIDLTIDDGTLCYAEVQLVSYSIPLEAKGAPTVSPFMFSWECNVGYWLSNGQPIYL